MVARTIACSNCGEHRRGREKDGEIRPIRDACHNCDATDYYVVGHEE